MFCTYVLYSPDHNKIYIGFTSNLEARLISHNSEKNKGYTRRFQPWILAYKEEFNSKVDAMKREKELKSAQGRKFIWERIIPTIQQNF